MADPGDGGGGGGDGADPGAPPGADREAVNPPPERIALAVWVIREAVALLFVVLWLLLLTGQLLTGAYTVPNWLHFLGAGVLAYALGLNVADLVVSPQTRPVRRVRERAR